MNRLPALSVVLCLAAVPAAGQDPVTSNPSVYRVVVDNPSVRVLRVTVPPGAKTTMHEHPDNVIVSLTDTKVRFTGADGKSQDAEMKADQVIWDAAKKHMGENVGPGGVDALVVELKGSAAPTATVPGDRAGLKATKLIDNPRAVVVRATPDASFSEPAGTTHPWDTVVIALAPSDTHVSVGGKTKDSWQRGDVLFIGRSVAHEAKAGKSPGDILLVAIK